MINWNDERNFFRIFQLEIFLPFFSSVLFQRPIFIVIINNRPSMLANRKEDILTVNDFMNFPDEAIFIVSSAQVNHVWKIKAKYRKERNWRDVWVKKWKIFMEEKLINYQKGGAWSYIMTVIIQQFNEKGKRIATYTIIQEYRSAYLFVSFPSYRTFFNEIIDQETLMMVLLILLLLS